MDEGFDSVSDVKGAYSTRNHFAFGGNELIAFDAGQQNGAPVSFQLVNIRADWTSALVDGPIPIFQDIPLPIPLTAKWVEETEHSHALKVRLRY